MLESGRGTVEEGPSEIELSPLRFPLVRALALGIAPEVADSEAVAVLGFQVGLLGLDQMGGWRGPEETQGSAAGAVSHASQPGRNGPPRGGGGTLERVRCHNDDYGNVYRLDVSISFIMETLRPIALSPAVPPRLAAMTTTPRPYAVQARHEAAPQPLTSWCGPMLEAGAARFSGRLIPEADDLQDRAIRAASRKVERYESIEAALAAACGPRPALPEGDLALKQSYETARDAAREARLAYATAPSAERETARTAMHAAERGEDASLAAWMKSRRAEARGQIAAIDAEAVAAGKATRAAERAEARAQRRLTASEARLAAKLAKQQAAAEARRAAAKAELDAVRERAAALPTVSDEARREACLIIREIRTSAHADAAAELINGLMPEGWDPNVEKLFDQKTKQVAHRAA